MYEAYWELSSKPFDDTADGRSYYPSESHQGALLKLRYAIENRRGGALIVGSPGLGKTMLVRTLARQLPGSSHPFFRLLFPKLSPNELVAYVAEELTGESSREKSTDHNLRRIVGGLADKCRQGQHVVVVIEDAHLLRDTATLETVRLLMNLEHEANPAMMILLVGQPSLLPILRRTPELEERLDAKCLLHRFSLEESISYLHHRLTAAGAVRTIFDDSALEAIHTLAQGTPRRINRLGDLALLLGYAEEISQITAKQIESLAEEMLVPAE